MDTGKQDDEIVIQIGEDFKGLEADVSKLRKLVEAICNRFDLIKASISIAIVDDGEMRKVNEEFLNQRSTTDCLSFDLSDGVESGKSFELVVNGEMAVREAAVRGHSSEAELALYITHGLLHHIGFDDTKPEQAKKMHDTEDEILRQQGYGRVYYSG